MIKAHSKLQDLRRKIYIKAKAETSWRFWGIYVHVCKIETLREAYLLSKQNKGAPGIDGVTFDAIEAEGVEEFLQKIQNELVTKTYYPNRNRRKAIPKSGGKFRFLSIPCIRDRVVQGALKLILEPVFEADFQEGSYGYQLKGIFRRFRSQPIDRVIYLINPKLRGWTNYFRIGNSSRCFDYVRDWVEKKVRRNLMHARKLRGFGWGKWSRTELYEKLGLFADYKIRYHSPKAARAR